MLTMLTTIKTYLMVALFVLLLGSGVYINKLQGDITGLYSEVATYKVAAESNLKAKEQADASCLISVEALSEHYRTENALVTAQQATGDAINALPTLTLKETAHAAPTKPQGFSDDDRLSPDLMQLLDNAYCDGDKDSCTSPTK